MTHHHHIAGEAGSAYYNEIDPFAAAWLRELIAAGHIAPGVVDERDIRDVRPDELSGYAQCHFFAGIGGWSLALRQGGWPDDRPVWTGSCPCQPFSAAGKRAGFADERHLWPALLWLISQARPERILGEQVADAGGLVWAELVHADLEGSGYSCGFVDSSAAGFGASFFGQRLYWLAEAESEGRRRRETLEVARGEKPRGPSQNFRVGSRFDRRASHSALAVSDVCAPSYGVPGRVGRLRGYGNSLHADQATAFIEAVIDVLDHPTRVGRG